MNETPVALFRKKNAGAKNEDYVIAKCEIQIHSFNEFYFTHFFGLVK